MINMAHAAQWLENTYGYSINTKYYNQINIWQDWWRGYHEPFHRVKEVFGTETLHRDLYSLKMAKKVCEDWASLLLNEKTEIVLSGEKEPTDSSQEYLDTLLEGLNFWAQANELVEKAFYSGTGAIVLNIDALQEKEEQALRSPGASVQMSFVPAQNILPLTIENGDITEAAFISEQIVRGKKRTYIAIHRNVESHRVITNHYFDTEKEQFKEISLPNGVLPEIKFLNAPPMFAIIKPNKANPFKGALGLGCSVFGEALDNLKGVDLAFNNSVQDFKLGGKKVFYSKSLVQHMQTDDGHIKAVVPDDVCQQLFVTLGDDDLQEIKIQEYNPKIRVDENSAGLQAQLDYLSFKCGFGTKHYQFNGSTIITATQYHGDKQELVQHATKHMIVLEKALKDVTRGVLWIAKNIQGLPVVEDAEITVNFEDGFVIDKEAEKESDKADVREGLLQAWEYRVKWYGEDEATAKAMTATPSLFGTGEGAE